MMGRLLCLCSLAVVLLVAACAPEPAATDPIARGRQVYRELGCANCHEGSIANFFRPVGPPLDRVGQAAAKRVPGLSAEDYLRQSITDPAAYLVPGYPDSMPRGLARDLSPEDLAALVAYLASLR
ncbi:MAG: c-type cytochrome [Chloroflexi bacterium]|nr:MAG: c-type cytochrome [Chloroflexota bacterium]